MQGPENIAVIVIIIVIIIMSGNSVFNEKYIFGELLQISFSCHRNSRTYKGKIFKLCYANSLEKNS